MRDSEFDFIRSLVYERSRISLGPDKRQLVSARLGKRLRATNLPSVGDYCQLLKSGQAGEELVHLIDAISTNHTFFFREVAHFEFLREKALPELAARARAERWRTLRVWSAACSSGEEPYSIAITLAEHSPTWPWQIEATDISHRILHKATTAIYDEESVAKLPANTLRAHFQRGFGPQAGKYRVKPALRERVNFQQLNLLEGEPPFSEPFQAIFCRNVMIYFDRPTQEELVGRLARLLVPGGFLFVGHSESLTHLRHPLQSLRPAIYQKPFGS
ncbi:MAG TPA: protein-glutamate O-methyltransferase CheR [Opitutaceae bacterium]|nr:protein-glutamate O-methyltransferase CheR [Opitutaceae bacterium]